MPKFNYKGRNVKGEMISGEVEAENTSAAAKLLMQTGVTPLEINISNTSESGQLKGLLTLRKKIKVEDLAMFCRQMQTLLDAGIPLNVAITKIAETTSNKVFQAALFDIKRKIEGGQTFASALTGHRKIFNELFIQIVDVGESSGQLEDMMQKLAVYMEHEGKTRKRIIAALRYPAIVLIVMIAAFIVINVFAIPSFASMYAQFHAELPLPTRILLGISNFMTHSWYWLLAIIIFTVFGLRVFLKTPKGKIALDWFKFHIPVVGKILFEATLARFTRIFATTISSGVPLLEGMQMACNILNNYYLEQSFKIMLHNVQQGFSITQSVESSKLFTPLVIQMMSVGEESGKLDELLNKVADFYEAEVDYKLSRLNDLIEPILITIIGGMLLVVALGVYLPMWNMANLVKH